jgi:hypothetical protein
MAGSPVAVDPLPVTVRLMHRASGPHDPRETMWIEQRLLTRDGLMLKVLPPKLSNLRKSIRVPL